MRTCADQILWLIKYAFANLLNYSNVFTEKRSRHCFDTPADLVVRANFEVQNKFQNIAVIFKKSVWACQTRMFLRTGRSGVRKHKTFFNSQKTLYFVYFHFLALSGMLLNFGRHSQQFGFRTRTALRWKWLRVRPLCTWLVSAGRLLSPIPEPKKSRSSSGEPSGYTKSSQIVWQFVRTANFKLQKRRTL